MRGLLIAAAVASALSLAVAPARADALQRLLQDHVEAEELPGGILLVSGRGGRHAAVTGLADLDKDIPVAEDTRFYAASAGKMAVAVAVLQMVEEGRLDLQGRGAALKSGVPGIETLPNARSATLAQLLDHSSGIPDYLNDAYQEESAANPKRDWTAAAAMAFARDEPATNRPGAGYSYSNTNYVLLGEIAAAIDGAPLEAVLKRRVLDRAGMRDTTIGARRRESRLAHGYADLDEDGEVEDASLANWNAKLGDGPLVTTAGDIEKFLFALFRDGKLLGPEMLERMSAPSEADSGYGLGVERGDGPGGLWLGHTGLADGFEAEARYYPAQATAMVFLTNGNSGSDESVLDRLAETRFHDEQSRPEKRRARARF